MNLILRYRLPLAVVLLGLIAVLSVMLVFGWRPNLLPGNAEVVLPAPTPYAAMFSATSEATQPASVTQTSTPAAITVYVAGAVLKPGVYTLDDAARVEDAVRAAGGPTADAALDRINLAARLHDEDQITVPRRSDPTSPPTRVAAATSASSNSTAGLPTTPININTADAATFETLPSIGPVLAARIVDYRAQNGPFTTIEELMNVPGIGQKLFDKIKGYVTV